MESPNEHAMLLDTIRSTSFNAFQCIHNLKNYRDHIGIQYELVRKLRTYSYDELEFFIPQLVQLLVAFETNSMALEEFLLDYSSRFPHFSLIVFWHLQAYVFELRNDPESYSFQTVRNIISKLQNIMFNAESPHMKQSEFRENIQPALVLCGAIAASVAAPRFNDYASALVKSQGKQQRSFVFKLANFQKSLTRNLTMKNTRISSDLNPVSHSDDERPVSANKSPSHHRSASLPRIVTKKNSISLSSDESEMLTDDDGDRKISIELEKELLKLEMTNTKTSPMKYSSVEENLRINTIIKSKKRNIASPITEGRSKFTSHVLNSGEVYNMNSHSLPNLSTMSESGSGPYLSLAESESTLLISPNSSEQRLTESIHIPKSSSVPTYNQLLKVLQVNYTKKETQFIMALQNISIRLSQVPKEARLSALRAELSIINDTLLPSEIDIPQLLPFTSNKNKKYHKILKLSINEACVLNSAERVPFLLLIEFLSDEIDFNPFTEYNEKIIAKRAGGIQVESKVGDFSRSSANSETEVHGSALKDIDIPVRVLTPDHEEADLGDLPMSMKRSGSSRAGVTSDGVKNNNPKILSPNPINTSEMSTKVLADQMRIASVMLQQLESAGKANSDQSLAIKARIVESMIALQDQFEYINYEQFNQLQGDVPSAGQRKLENDFKLAEDWNVKKERIRSSSAYGHLENWDICSVIAKNGDDLPQEAFACQLITMISNIWKADGISAWTKRMKILITSANTGLVETITNAMSIHSIKKSLTEISVKNGENSKGRIITLLDYYERLFGKHDSPKFKQAQDNFASSLAAYSIICYILQIKDRHNGNIMVDNEGHIIHIDFGFLLSNSPGSVGFEAAPFKLTSEYVDLLGGLDSPAYAKFVMLCKECFNSLRENSDQIIDIVELMQKDSSLPCFNNGDNTSVLLKQRLQLQLSRDEADEYVDAMLIGKSLGSMYTRLYDQFQMITQGIYS
ncbi:phosphatidylinositol 4-kinase [Spathaspora passalidarum NRRL Y-27907]|uniref:1-phosphatidylinositol 4-kinase n=1 Tax=Spathaspora passalidarum (strain NRRL Y-27907 / 11-Y1) TaxID=619300 RepID=G3ANQ7_SPAPN|nr:phosphatidylinositol 4-kinase [Spathaspora passalidarum NRRL Y-27907]EGW31992.1 phosphatidylinositol 4-kinase [Spathaspora passalidarum NRRL Y-27907]